MKEVRGGSKCMCVLFEVPVQPNWLIKGTALKKYTFICILVFFWSWKAS